MKVGKWRCCPVLIDETNGNIPPRPDLPKASSGNLMSERTNRPRAPIADLSGASPKPPFALRLGSTRGRSRSRGTGARGEGAAMI